MQEFKQGAVWADAGVVDVRVWIVSLYDDSRADGYAIYCLSDDRLQKFTRVWKRSADKLARRLMAGPRSRGSVWVVRLGAITHVDFDASSCRMEINAKRSSYLISPESQLEFATSGEITKR